MSSSRFPLPHCSVRTKILALFLALSLITLIVMGYVALFTIGSLAKTAESGSFRQGEQAVDMATAALQQSAEQYLLQAASDQAAIAGTLFNDTETELNLLSVQAITLQGNPPLLPVIRSSGRDTPPADPRDATLFLFSPGSTVTTDSEEFSKSAGMDDLLQGMYVTDSDLVSVFLATDSGILRSYPWENTEVETYDPRTRAWFTGAKGTNGVYWSKPYVDSFGHGLVVTSSKAITTPYGAWVIGSDVRVDVINREFLNNTLGGRGYAVLIDNSGDIISRPQLAAVDHRWDQPFPQDNVFATQDPALRAAGKNMTEGRTGVERVQFNGVDTFVAYAPIPSQNWSVAVCLPVSEVTAPIDQTRAGITTSSRETEALIAEQSDHVKLIFSLLSGLLLIVVIALSVALSKAITRPVDTLRQATQAIGKGDLAYRVELRTGDEFEELADSFNHMAADLRHTIDDLQRTTAEKERYASEMEIAREIQQTFLPETIPEIPGFEIAATTIPAMEIGGDLYDFIPQKNGSMGFVIADVSGKGVSAALYMALCRTQIHTCGTGTMEPAEAIDQANRLIYDEGRSSMFITVFYAVLDPRTMTLSYVNAGHNPPLLIRGDPPLGQMFEGKGIALGVIDDTRAKPWTLPLRHGDLIIMYTDGVTEAFNERDEYYSEERMMDVITRNRNLPAREIGEALIEDIRLFAGSAPQSDDITFILVKVR
ncbi:SpoIIE family protein phosphatase [Methanoregula sp.]|uniref:SpoIIE family protein phosphatase n=1 Tax=Methanoregula sp. TaxID=2052170 RepID=UPI000CB4A155|nr:SpoIIE family protein phosphatase [Methanoregula sp.]PKG32930.1 MAG: serine/threonine protein phosphatase [Methanoregula sp.]